MSMSSGMTYYTVAYHMQPIANFRSYWVAVKFADEERIRRLEALKMIDPPMLSSELRGEERSIVGAVAVREVNIKFEDGPAFEEVKFEQ